MITDTVRLDVEDRRDGNPFTELLLLNGHTDIVRFLVRLDNNRCCSAGDDGKIIIWQISSGIALHTLTKHSRPVSCLQLLQDDDDHHHHRLLLLSSSPDRLICIWDTVTGHLIQTLTEHSGTAKCLATLPWQPGHFCSSGNRLCLWNIDGSLLHSVATLGIEDIQQMIAVNHCIIIAAGQHIIIYRQKTPSSLDLAVTLPSHREPVKSLVRIDDKSFASGSLDGAVVHWSLPDGDMIRQYNVAKNYLGANRLFPYSIQYMTCVDEKYLICATGSGFNIYDTSTNKLIVKQKNAHDGKTLHVSLIYNGYLLVSCSDDGKVKIWGQRLQLNSVTSDEDDKSPGQWKFQRKYYKRTDVDSGSSGISLDLISEFTVHSGAVECCVDINPGCFLSAGADRMVIAWQDRLASRCLHHVHIRNCLFGIKQ